MSINNAAMSVGRAQRIHEGLITLVDRLIPPEEAANDAEADEIHDHALDLAQRIVDRWTMLHQRFLIGI